MSQWSQISEEELENIVEEIRTITPNIGERRLILSTLRFTHIGV